jgi:type VII secretion protein EccE
VSCGHRVRRGAGYPPLYSTLLADRPAAGQRDTRLIVGLDLTDSVRGLSYRTSIGAAAAAATERIINALLQEGIRAAALNAAELDAALEELSAGLADAPEPPEEQVDADVDARVPVLAGAPSGVLPRRMTLAPTGQPLSSERGQLVRLRQADWNPERMVVQ